MRTASMSVPMNIAEGYGKNAGANEFKRFLRMAMGSSTEMQVLLSFSKDFGYMTEKEYSKESDEYEQIGKMINSLIKKVGENQQIK